MTAPIQIENIWKFYGSTPAVRGLSLLVPPGTIYGFLGPNGAGKSTTIRMILGLQRPDRGSVRLFGAPPRAGGLSALSRTGSLVEAPSLYLHLTGRENLEVHRRLLDAPVPAIDRALTMVDLSGAAHQLVREYSSGMKQRLGIAQALLGNPELLVLDEPTNGLDPAGIHEVRSLIRQLPQRGAVTIFLSSHLLAEVEQVATHLAIVSAGEVRFEGTAEELRSLSQPSIVAEVDDPAKAAEVLSSHGIAASIEPPRIVIADHGGFSPAGVNSLLVHSGIAVSEFLSRRPTLEETFLGLTGNARSASKEPVE